MWKNYIITAIRNLVKHQFYTFLNIFGLSASLAICLLIFFYVQHELSYDNYHENKDRIYRTVSEIHFGGNEFNEPMVQYPYAESMKDAFPEIEEIGLMRGWGTELFKYKDRAYKVDLIISASNGMFKILDIPLIEGNKNDAIKNTKGGQLALSQSFAEKVFGEEKALSQILYLNDTIPYEITAVYEDFPMNSYFHGTEMLANIQYEDTPNYNSWLSNNFHAFFLLNENTNIKDLEEKITSHAWTFIGPEIEKFMGVTLTEEEQKGTIEYHLQKLEDIYLNSSFTYELNKTSDVQYVYIFSAIAFFILLIACINYINLSTAKSADRAKEVGVRKVLGASRIQLIYQFISESMLLSFTSLIIAILFVENIIPYFNEISGKELVTEYNGNFGAFIAIIVFLIIIGVLAGSYPALFLSSFVPSRVLKGSLNTGMKSGKLRSILVTFQFMVSIFLIACTLVIFKQLSYIQNKNIGYDRENVILVSNTNYLSQSKESFKEAALKKDGIVDATITSFYPIEDLYSSNSAYWPNRKVTPEEAVLTQQYHVDQHYIQTMKMSIIAGRNFNHDITSDSNAVIINETAVKRFNLGEDPINKKIYAYRSIEELGEYRVVGVIKDFNHRDLRQAIGPSVFHLAQQGGEHIAFRIESGSEEKSIENIQAVWNEFLPNVPFEYNFLDEYYDRMYKEEKRTGNLFATLSIIAIIVACLGLFGLAAFTAEQKTKEIGVRKVLGATIWQIVSLLSKEFGKLILFAFMIAAPLSYYIMTQWLENFQYRISFSIDVLLIAGLLSGLTAWLTMSYHTIRAARTSPAYSLKNE